MRDASRHGGHRAEVKVAGDAGTTGRAAGPERTSPALCARGSLNSLSVRVLSITSRGAKVRFSG